MIVITTWGSITAETAACWGNMREAMVRQNLSPVWHFVPGALVDRARNQAVTQMLAHQPPLGWLLFIDGDAVFAPDAAARILMTAFGDEPSADVVGGFCTLRGEPFLPTIDTGTGTWESVLPGQGVMDVMRTGSAFVLIKRHCFEKVPGPWYGTRNPMRPIDALAEVDNFAHTRFDGRNPLTDYPEWHALMKCATDDPSTHQRHRVDQFVGEDSDFCDKARFYGLRVVVNTDVEVHHVDRVVRSAADHRKWAKQRDADLRRLVGVQK
jgi:hypothetical protein